MSCKSARVTTSDCDWLKKIALFNGCSFDGQRCPSGAIMAAVLRLAAETISWPGLVKTTCRVFLLALLAVPSQAMPRRFAFSARMDYIWARAKASPARATVSLRHPRQPVTTFILPHKRARILRLNSCLCGTPERKMFVKVVCLAQQATKYSFSSCAPVWTSRYLLYFYCFLMFAFSCYYRHPTFPDFVAS